MTILSGRGSGWRFDRDEWHLILVTFLVISVVFGCGRFTFPTVITPMRDHLGTTRETMALLVMGNLVGYLLGSIIAAAAGRRSRSIVLPALFSCAVCIVGLIASPNVVFTAALLVVLGFSGGLAFVAAAGLISTRFGSDRGRAVGVAMAGIGAGTAVSSGLSALLLPAGGQAWRFVWVVTAIYAALVVFAASKVYPGLRAPGPAAERPEVTPVTTSGTASRVPARVVVDRRRWFLFAAYLTWGFGQVIQITLLPEFLVEERGLAAGTASVVYGVSGLTMFVASPLVGLYSDRIGRRVMYGLCLGCGVVAVAMVLAGGSVPIYLTGSLLFGIPVSGVGALTPALVADLWRPEQFAAVFGGMTAIFGVIQASGPSLAAISIAKTGSMQTAYVASLVFCGIALLCAAGLPSARSRPIPAACAAPGI